jgi:glycosyltransferase involved in cell wall biosynthesis
MKIAIIKPDYKISGGFETVVSRIREWLIEKGHDVHTIIVDMVDVENPMVPHEIYSQNKQFFDYALSIKKFQELDLKGYDLVISTQPPSYCIEHNRHLMLFYHHMKIYYDLYELVMEIGLINRKYHRLAAKYIRDIEGYYLTDKKFFAVGSSHVAERLKRYNGIVNNVYQFNAGIDDFYYNYNGPKSFQYPTCVGRHEFPKRTELFIQAMKYLNMPGTLIGSGGQTQLLKDVDIMLTYNHFLKNKDIDSHRLYKHTVFNMDSYDIGAMKDALTRNDIESNVLFAGRLPLQDLIANYADALCVVCPAYEEDYGLTAIEAMAFGKPVIACNDGGGYCELIKHKKTGFIVAPDANEIAECIRYLDKNRDILKKMSSNAYEESRKYSWDNGLKDFAKILDMVIKG